MRRAAAVLLFATIACTSSKPPAQPVDENTRRVIEQITAAVEKQPDHAPLIYVLATYHDRARDAASVVKWLTRLDELGWEHGVAPDGFRNTNTPAFRAIAAKLDAREPRVNRARVAFTLANQRDLIPEGIAFDPVDDVFYVSGIHRRNVLRVDRNGRATEFISEARDGMLGGLGVKVDGVRRLLWVISSTTPEMRGWKEGENASMLAAYDLRDGKLVRKIEATPAILNDLTLLADGSLFATDMGRHKVVRLAPEATSLGVFAENFSFPNGITVSEDERILYVADFGGITRIDLHDNSRTKLESKSLLSGIDGLSMHQSELIAIQNAVGKARVIRIDPEHGHVEILESKNGAFEIPTTGAVAGDEYFFIANPGLRSFNEDHSMWPMDKLEDPVMLKLAL
ncbi:MAG TPA: SMP-30/gluconolactonase/LRE family protein [Thermoanaerobaculia bacterium]|nr:SMP-30/gluconolactonase/LRE family protein [Thermoanaerobaculia bacterium]